MRICYAGSGTKMEARELLHYAQNSEFLPPAGSREGSEGMSEGLSNREMKIGLTLVTMIAGFSFFCVFTQEAYWKGLDRGRAEMKVWQDQ